MFELLVVIAFLWLVMKGFGLAFRVAWSLAKVVEVILFVLEITALLV